MVLEGPREARTLWMWWSSSGRTAPSAAAPGGANTGAAWSRNAPATELRKEFGIEAARIILGHRSAAITEVYAEKDEQQAIEAMMKIG